jgi:hypothetical protein
MKVGQLGNLKTKLKSDIVRLSYMPRNERGFEEYVIVFEKSVPKMEDEPRFFKKASEIEARDGEIALFYPELNTEVVLLTKKKDDEFRSQFPEIVGKMEVFRIDQKKRMLECKYDGLELERDTMKVDIKCYFE